MSQDNPLLLLALAGLTAYVFSIWLGDLCRARAGAPDARAFPGAVSCSWVAVVIAIVGALVLLGLETGGENLLGVSGQQSNISALYLLAMLSAAFGEELVFRGYLVVTSRGNFVLLASVVGFSLLFALGHPFLWDWKNSAEGQSHQLLFDFSIKAWWSTAMVFLFSFWSYALRFPLRYPKLNPQHSLIPCIAAHLAKNLGVFIIKLAQGHVTHWW